MHKKFLAKAPQGALAGFVLLLSGCAWLPERMSFGQVDTSAPETLNTTLEQAGKALSKQQFSAPWWQVFADPGLNELEALALAQNNSLKIAATHVEESRARAGIARAAQLPSIGLGGGYSRSAISSNSPLYRIGASPKPHDTWNVGLQAGWELDLWGHLSHLSEAAKAELEASQYGFASVQVSLTAQIASEYLLLRDLQEQHDLAQALYAQAQQLDALTLSRVKNGVATQQSLDDVRALVAQRRAVIAPLDQALHSAKNRITALLGMKPGELDAQLALWTKAPLQQPTQIPVGIPSGIARTRPDILAAEARLRVAVESIDAARADFYPRIDLTGNLGTQAFYLHDLGSWGDSRTFAIGPTFYLPIFEGGRLRQTLALTEARQQAAAIGYQQTVLNAWKEVDDALSGYRNQQRTLKDLNEVVLHRQQALDSVKFSVSQGAADQLALAQAKSALLEAKSAQTAAQSDALLSVVALYRALGGGWQPELQPAQTAAADKAQPSAVDADATVIAAAESRHE